MAADHDCMVVVLLMSDEGTPGGVEDRLSRAASLIEKLTSAGKELDEIIVDPCFLPVSVDPSAGRSVTDAIGRIRVEWPNVHIGGGCSNISFGLPKRRFINLALLCQAIWHGMDVGIIDPCVEGIVSTILAAEAVAGMDEFCMNYVTAMKQERA
jgi:5-methyltetrahydrofolate--homocysteine methyltransferase